MSVGKLKRRRSSLSGCCARDNNGWHCHYSTFRSWDFTDMRALEVAAGIWTVPDVPTALTTDAESAMVRLLYILWTRTMTKTAMPPLQCCTFPSGLNEINCHWLIGIDKTTWRWEPEGKPKAVATDYSHWQLRCAELREVPHPSAT